MGDWQCGVKFRQSTEMTRLNTVAAQIRVTGGLETVVVDTGVNRISFWVKHEH